MSGPVLLTLVLPLVVVALVAAVSGALSAWWFLHRRQAVSEPTQPPTTEFADTELVDAEIDLAAVAWAEARSLPPEAAGLMAARLKTLHDIGSQKGWF